MFDALFLRQVWEGNESMLLELVRDASALGRARLHYFVINKGPWSRLDHNEPFVPGAPSKLPQANFYAAGTTKAEVEAWLGTLSDAERRRATGFFTGGSSPCRMASSIRASWRRSRACCGTRLP